MSQQFSLAGIKFDPVLFEVPEDFEFGTDTWGSMHNIPQSDGATPKRIAQVFGTFPQDMHWSARFLGNDAEQKVRKLKAAQVNQLAVPLVLGRYLWDVVIFKFTIKQRSRYDIGYSIEVKALTDRAGSVPNGLIGQGAGTNLRVQQTQITTLLTDQAAADTRAATAVANANAALTAVLSAQPEQQASSSTLTMLGLTMGSVSTASTALQVLTASSTLAADQSLYLWATKLLSASQSYINTLQTFTGQDGSNQVTLNVGQDMFTLAATQLGDWTRFTDLLNVNNQTDPFALVSGKVSLPRN